MWCSNCQSDCCPCLDDGLTEEERKQLEQDEADYLYDVKQLETQKTNS